ncbi:MAG: hypothetical protein KDB82_11605 [Planctomycetes bacterium]|nr:hypothetical protein [Planctomycetota bacterium]
MKSLQVKYSWDLRPCDLPTNFIALSRDDAERYRMVWKSTHAWADSQNVIVNLSERALGRTELSQCRLFFAACDVELVHGDRLEGIAGICGPTLTLCYLVVFKGSGSAYMPIDDKHTDGRTMYEFRQVLDQPLDEIYPAKLNGAIPLLDLNFSSVLRVSK